MPKPLEISFLLPFDEAIEAAKKRGVKLPEDYYSLPVEKRREAFTVSGLSALDQVQAVKDALDKHLASGGTLQEFQRWANSQNFGIPKHRLETIYRNSVQTAYNAGHWRNFEEHQDSRGYLMYDAINDGRVRPAHKALDGIIRPVGDPFWETRSPPNGHRCRCGLLSLTEDQALSRSRPDKDGNPQGLHKPVTPDMKADDAGWGGKPTEWGETLDGLIDKKRGQCDVFGFAPERSKPPIWCKGEGKAFLASLDAADNGGMESSVKFVEVALQNKSAKQKPHVLGYIDTGAIDKAAETGIDIKGKQLALDHDGVLHTIKKHGGQSELKRGQAPITPEDISLFGALFNQAEMKPGNPPVSNDGTKLIECAAIFDGFAYTVIAKVRRMFVVPFTMHKREIK